MSSVVLELFKENDSAKLVNTLYIMIAHSWKIYGRTILIYVSAYDEWV